MLQSYKLQVRFSDCDMMQHVNNAVYLNYFEEARIHYFHQIVGQNWDWNKFGIILRKNEIEYLKPILFNEPVEIVVKRLHIGDKSFVLSYDVSVNNELRAIGNSVLVSYDNTQKKSTPIPDILRNGLMKFETKEV